MKPLDLDDSKILETAKGYRTLTMWAKVSPSAPGRTTWRVETSYGGRLYDVSIWQKKGAGFDSVAEGQGEKITGSEAGIQAKTADEALLGWAKYLSAMMADRFSRYDKLRKIAESMAELWGVIYDTDLEDYERQSDPNWRLPTSPIVSAKRWVGLGGADEILGRYFLEWIAKPGASAVSKDDARMAGILAGPVKKDIKHYSGFADVRARLLLGALDAVVPAADKEEVFVTRNAVYFTVAGWQGDDIGGISAAATNAHRAHVATVPVSMASEEFRFALRLADALKLRAWLKTKTARALGGSTVRVSVYDGRLTAATRDDTIEMPAEGQGGLAMNIEASVPIFDAESCVAVFGAEPLLAVLDWRSDNVSFTVGGGTVGLLGGDGKAATADASQWPADVECEVSVGRKYLGAALKAIGKRAALAELTRTKRTQWHESDLELRSAAGLPVVRCRIAPLRRAP